MIQYQKRFYQFNSQKTLLGNILSNSANLISELNLTYISKKLNKLNEILDNYTFKIMVIGNLGYGKSTLINSLLGESVLPAYPHPCNAVIMEIKYGENKEAILHFRSPLPENINMNHMKDCNLESVPPLKIGCDEIENYVCIPMGLESPYEKIELFWPHEILKDGVEIIDYPALNGAENRPLVTMKYLSKADAILFVLNAAALCSKDEMDFIENNLIAADPFFIVNKFDFISDSQKECVQQFAKVKLADYSTNEIFFVSAQQAIDGETNQNKELYEKSNMSNFTNVLSDFLIKHKGKVELSQLAHELKNILNSEVLSNVIPGQRVMLDCPLDDVKNRYEQSRPQLENLRVKKEQLINKLQLKISQSEQEFRRACNRNILDLNNQIIGWINAYEPKTGIMPPTKTKLERLITEISNYVSGKIETYQNEWKNTVLIPLVNERLSLIFESIETDVSKLYEQIDITHRYIAGNTGITPSDGVSALERGGFLLGGAYAGGTTGLGAGLAKTIAMNISGFILLNVLGFVNPVPLVADLISGNIFGSQDIKKKVKNMVAEQITNNLTANSNDTTDEIVKKISEELTKISTKLGVSLDDEIKSVEQQVNGIIAEIKKGKSNIEIHKKLLDSCENKIKCIISELDTYFDLSQ